MRAGHGYRPELDADPIQLANGWIDGRMITPRYEPVTVGTLIDWSLDPFDASWLFRFHNLEYVFSILHAYEETGNQAYLDRVQEILESWTACHSTVDDKSPVWARHTTAMRSQALAYSASYFDEAWLARALLIHGRFLSDPANFSGAWNHGFDECLGLMAVGGALHEDAFIDLAVERATNSISTMVDVQGVTNEQASVYHFYVWKLFGQFEQELERCHRPRPEILHRRDEILVFLAHATQPDGLWVPVGDALSNRAVPVEKSVLEYAATRGEAGHAPQERIRVFDGGWAFGRTGWGTTRPFKDESFYSIRFGARRQVHGHIDHTALTYFTGGRSVLLDAGFSGYANPVRRAYEQQEYGHNQVVLAGRGEYRVESTTELTSWECGNNWQRFELTGEPYAGTRRRRTVLAMEDPEFILVHDRVESSRPGPNRQLWHVAPGFVASQDGGEVTLSDDSGIVKIIQCLPVDNIDIAAGTRGSATTGWVGIGLNRYAPAPLITTRKDGKNAEFLTVIAATAKVTTKVERDLLSVSIGDQTTIVGLDSMVGPFVIDPAQAREALHSPS